LNYLVSAGHSATLSLLGERDLRDTVWLVTDARIRSRHAEIKK